MGLLLPMASGVYALRIATTGEVYIGSSKNMYQRAHGHLSEVRHLRNNLSLYVKLAEHGVEVIEFEVIEACEPEVLREREYHWIAELKPALNQYKNPACDVAYTKEVRAERAERARRLWADPEYRANGVAKRKGKGGPVGYKCTPEQIENRRRAGRISQEKRRAK